MPLSRTIKERKSLNTHPAGASRVRLRGQREEGLQEEPSRRMKSRPVWKGNCVK